MPTTRTRRQVMRLCSTLREYFPAALRRARRRNPEEKAAAAVAALRAPQLGQPPVVTAAYAAIVPSLVRMISAAGEKIAVMEEQVAQTGPRQSPGSGTSVFE